jgi:condensin complex subunit 3
MICAGWMKAVRYDPVALLGLVDPVLHETECIKVAQVILDVVANAEGTSVPAVLDELSDPEIRAFKEGVSSTAGLLRTNADSYLEPRAALFARVKCDRTNASKSLTEARKADIIGKIVPDIPILCETLQMHIARLVEAVEEGSDAEEESEALQDCDIFVCSQLLQMAQAMDLKEEGSRRHFISVMKNLLEAVETPDDLLEGCIKAMKFAHEHERTFLQAINDLVSELSTASQGKTSIMEEVMQIRIISILAITLENTSARMASDSSLSNFAAHVVPAVTSSHGLVREGGVSCLGRLAILCDQKTVLEEFKPLLLRVASNAEEKLEIRAQALMAICDLSFVFDGIISPYTLSPDDYEGKKEVIFVSLLSEMISTSKPAVVAVASEVAAKLLFSGRTFDSNLVADLLVTYFDQGLATLASEVEDDVMEIGSPVRMQQLLSLFFPAYSMRSAECRSALVASVGPMLVTVSAKLDKKGAKVSNWPVGRMIEYVESLLLAGTQHVAKEPFPCSQDIANDNQEDSMSSSQQEPSYVVRMGMEIAQFLVKAHENLKTTFSRQLCKFLGTLDIAIDSDEASSISKLKKYLDELGMCITDSTSLRSLKPVMELLDNSIDDDEESDSQSTVSEASSLAEALHAIEIAERESIEQENKAEEQVTRKDSDVKPSRGRRRLATVN